MAAVIDRRRGRRRSIPYVRSAVLEVAGRSHIVAVLDLGAEGAFLQTQAKAEVGERLLLRIVLPRNGRQEPLPCQVVWRADQFDVATGRPAGMAVRFTGLEAGVVRRVEEFAIEGFLPGAEPTPQAHYEYRLLVRNELDADELNRWGLDGWQLSGVVPQDAGLKLILQRRL
jgi:Tfp pilus assembly protein PilZ